MTFLRVVIMLSLSNTFMLFAWYSHLKNQVDSPLWQVILLSWGIAFFEYSLMIPANRLGSHVMTIPQLKILQEVISLSVFVPFVVFYMHKPLSWNYLWATLCILGAVYFIFRDKMVFS